MLHNTQTDSNRIVFCAYLNKVGVNLAVGEKVMYRVQVHEMGMRAQEDFELKVEHSQETPAFEAMVHENSEVDAIIQKVSIGLDFEWLIELDEFFSSIWPREENSYIQSTRANDIELMCQIREQRLLAPLRESISADNPSL